MVTTCLPRLWACWVWALRLGDPRAPVVGPALIEPNLRPILDKTGAILDKTGAILGNKVRFWAKKVRHWAKAHKTGLLVLDASQKSLQFLIR